MKFRGAQKSAIKTVNLAGGEAYKETTKLELVSLLLTSFVQDKFYEKAEDQLARLRALVGGIADKEFVAKAAIYARNEFGMRSITHALIGELVKQVKGEVWMKSAVRQAVRRPDDMLEIAGYYISRYGRKGFPNSLKKGLREAVGRFDAYQLGKYRGEGSDFKMVDLFNLVRPDAGVCAGGYELQAKSDKAKTWKTIAFKPADGKPEAKNHRLLSTALRAKIRLEKENPKNEYRIIRAGTENGKRLVDFESDAKDVLFAKLMAGELKSTGTWETKLTAVGQEASAVEDATEKAEALTEGKKAVWKELLTPDKHGRIKLGYFALLRNLRNIIEQAPDAVALACKALVDEKQIRKSLVMPFRFMTALLEIHKLGGVGTRKVVEAIHEAVDIAVGNVPKFNGKTLVVLDTSSSMMSKGTTSNKNPMTPAQIGSLFAAALYRANDADLMTFDSDSRFVSLHAKDSVLSIADRLMQMSHGGSTNFPSIFARLKEKYDRVIILSDMQGWDTNSGDGYFGGSSSPVQAFGEYKKRSGASPHVFSFDLNGYGTLQFPEKQVYCLAGWSEKSLDVMKLLEEDRNALIHKIEAIKLN